MNNLIDLAKYRQQRKSGYLKSHEAVLNSFFEAFLSRNFKETFSLLSAQYLACKVSQNEMAWDYYDFRDSLKEAIASVYGPAIWAEINRTSWFDPRIVSQEEIMERCTSFFILRETMVANQ